MRQQIRSKLASLAANERLQGTDGAYHDMDGITKIPFDLCEFLYRVHALYKPALSIETGFAYGFSTISILSAMQDNNYGHHIAIDPTQKKEWHGVGLVAIQQLQLQSRFTHMDARSDAAMTRLIDQKKRAQFVFLDGLHLFESIMADVAIADQILDPGGVLIINDMWMPAVRSVASYITRNMSHMVVSRDRHANVFMARKSEDDKRAWDDFRAFDGRGLAVKDRKWFGLGRNR